MVLTFLISINAFSNSGDTCLISGNPVNLEIQVTPKEETPQTEFQFQLWHYTGLTKTYKNFIGDFDVGYAIELSNAVFHITISNQNLRQGSY